MKDLNQLTWDQSVSSKDESIEDIINRLHMVSGEVEYLASHSLMDARSRASLMAFDTFIQKIKNRLKARQEAEDKELRPTCHVDNCQNDTYWKFWDHKSPGEPVIACIDCIPELLLPGHHYTIEPWDTELSKEEKDLVCGQRIDP